MASPEVSPLFADIPAQCVFPPTVISSGTRDLLLSDSVRLAAKLRAAGVTVELRVAEGLWHVFEWYPELPEARASLHGVASFLATYLHPTPMLSPPNQDPNHPSHPSHEVPAPPPTDTWDFQPATPSSTDESVAGTPGVRTIARDSTDGTT